MEEIEFTKWANLTVIFINNYGRQTTYNVPR